MIGGPDRATRGLVELICGMDKAKPGTVHRIGRVDEPTLQSGEQICRPEGARSGHHEEIRGTNELHVD